MITNSDGKEWITNSGSGLEHELSEVSSCIDDLRSSSFAFRGSGQTPSSKTRWLYEQILSICVSGKFDYLNI